MNSISSTYSGNAGSNEIMALIDDISHDTKEILNGQNYTRSEIMKIYQKVYNYCSISEKSMPIKNSEKDFTSLGICGSLLYENMSSLFSEHFEMTKQKISESFSSFLEIYMLEWNKALLSAHTLDSVFSYMNRHWVKQQQTQTDKKIYKIFNLIVIKWAKIIFYTFHNQLFDEIFCLITKHREGQDCNMDGLLAFCNHLQILSTDRFETTTGDGTKKISRLFKTEFIPKFMEQTNNFYIKYGAKLFSENTPFEYIKKIKNAMNLEKIRVEKYIHPYISNDVAVIIQKTCINTNISRFYQEFLRMLDESLYSDVKFLYDIIRERDDVNRELKSIFQTFMKRVITACINQLGTFETINPINFINKLADIFRHYDQLVIYAFGGDPLFQEAKNNAYDYAINNCFDKIPNTQNSSKIMAKYVHILLTQYPESCHSIQSQAHFLNLIRALEHIDNREVFKLSAIEYLASRLLENTSLSYQAEMEVVKLFSEKFNDDFVSEMEKMIIDMNDNSHINHLFVATSASYSHLCPYINTLTSTAWPYSHLSDINLPLEISSLYKEFEAWYMHRFNGRRLKFLDHLTRVVLEISFTNKIISIDVSGFQASVLILFQSSNSYSFFTIQKETNLEHKMLAITLHTLVEAGLLFCSFCIDDHNFLDIPSVAVFSFNCGFDSQNQCVRIPHPINYKTETIDYINNGGFDINLTTQAAIVRIMKHSKVLDRQVLIYHVFENLIKFKVSKELINKNISFLIDREFIKYDSDKEIYIYIE